LPSNQRSTTCECVHLVRRGHFWSRGKDGGSPLERVTARFNVPPNTS